MKDIDVLRGIPLFKDLKERDLRKILKVTYEKKYRKNEVIFDEKATGAVLYIVRYGEVVILKKAKINGMKEKVVSLLKTKETFGEMSLMDGGPRSATAKAWSPDTRILIIYKGDFDKIKEKYPQIVSRINELLCQRLRTVDKQLVEFAQWGYKIGKE